MKNISILLLVIMSLGLLGCKGISKDSAAKPKEIQVQVFAASSLQDVMEELILLYEEEHPQIKVLLQTDSSGVLMTQIREGFACDLFFSAGEQQMDVLEREGLLVEETRRDLLNNQLVVIAGKEGETKVTGLATLGEAESIAIAGGSVPAGYYTRLALVTLGILKEEADIKEISTKTISDALGGVVISEGSNVRKVLLSVAEGSCEAGTVYYSDLHGQAGLRIIEAVPNTLTGDILYPISLVKNPQANSLQHNSAREFYEFLLSESAKEVFKEYDFDTNVKE